MSTATELMRRALEHLEWCDEECCNEKLEEQIRAYLAAEPAIRKPMTHEEIIQGVTVDTSDDFHAGYWAGVRYAEKHHGIGGDDE